jgi:predicted SAM-dependent methyltransferase
VSISKSLKQKIPDWLKFPLRAALRAYLWIYGRIALISPLNSFKVAKFKKYTSLKLNVGCGKAKLAGWVNIDIEPGADLVIDVRKGLPFGDNSLDFIYSEHVLEHLLYEEGEKLLKECRRCLKKGGALRLAMPDLDYIIQKYNTDWENQDWLLWPEYEFIKTKGQMINIGFRWWGHKYLYNEEDLRNQLIGAGFQKVARCNWNESSHAELSGLETRRDSKLIMEAIIE